MKVQRITFGSKSQIQQTPTNTSRSEFLYYPKPKENHNTMNFLKVLGALAAGAVGITLFNLKRNKVPLSIVDIAGTEAGLNKINFRRTALELKKKILYPIKTGSTGDSKNFKSGLILSDTKDKPLKDILAAFCEHADKIGIKTVTIPDNLNKAARRRWVFNEIETAQKEYKSSGKFTIINIDNIDNLIDLKIVKAKNSAIEEKLIEINKNVYSGIVWTGWTNNTKSIPMYYNNLPVLVTKLVD